MSKKLYTLNRSWSPKEATTLSDYMKGEVSGAGGHGYGQLEQMEAELDKLRDMFADLLDALPDKTSDRLADIWNLEEAKDEES